MTAIQDIAFVRQQAPDLNRMETFLIDYGLGRATAAEPRVLRVTRAAIEAAA